jgi:16S rRNA (guanine527-N7)-methyltransferase
VDLLKRWNARFNLVSRRDVDRLWPRHVLDSLSVLPAIRERVLVADASRETPRGLDVGTGAGFPGIPLAIAESDIHWHLVDRNARKIRFLEMVVAELGLPNVVPRCMDIREDEAVREIAGDGFDLIVSRAVTRPGDLLTMVGRWLGAEGVMVLLTGVSGSDPGGDPVEGLFREEARLQFEIPGLDRGHEVTIIRHTG